ERAPRPDAARPRGRAPPKGKISGRPGMRPKAARLMIISSLLDTDLYKFTMMQVVLHHFPAAQAEYRFKCRNAGVDLTPCIADIRREIRDLCKLRFSRRELDYLRSWRFFTSDFADLLGLFQLDERFIDVRALPGGEGEIDITIKGPWLHTIMFEVPVLAIVSEIYNRHVHPEPDFAEGERRLAEKVEQLNSVRDPEFRIADYGTRRRFSRAWQEQRRARARAQPDAARHDGARVSAGVPGRRAAASRLAGVRVQHLGARISRRPRDRAVR